MQGTCQPKAYVVPSKAGLQEFPSQITPWPMHTSPQSIHPMVDPATSLYMPGSEGWRRTAMWRRLSCGLGCAPGRAPPGADWGWGRERGGVGSSRQMLEWSYICLYIWQGEIPSFIAYSNFNVVESQLGWFYSWETTASKCSSENMGTMFSSFPHNPPQQFSPMTTQFKGQCVVCGVWDATDFSWNLALTSCVILRVSVTFAQEAILCPRFLAL